MIGGVFGMNITIPWQNFIDDPSELFNPDNLYKEAIDAGIYTKIFSYSWFLETSIPLLPFACVMLLATNLSCVLYYFLTKYKLL